MKLHNWKIFGKNGSPLNWFSDPYLSLNFGSTFGKNATGYIVTDPSGYSSEVKVTNSGYKYDYNTTVSYTYLYSDGTPIDITSDVSITYKDVSIFNPDLTNTLGIKDVSVSSVDVSTVFVYPSVVYSSAIFLKPVSQGLIETEHLFILEQDGANLIRPYDSVNSTLVFEMYGEEDQISLFSVNEEEQVINWTNQLIYDISVYDINTPITVNIGFKADSEGVYERKLRIYHVIDNIYYLMAEIMVNAEAIGEDERFRTLIGNFGLPDPKDFPKLFKEVDINEDLPDWELLNQKSKHMILEHDHIMPFIGTYKALVNAIKWLGYEDIYIREWFKNVKDNRLISLIIPYDAKERSKTILIFSPEERKVLKKLNQLSLNYCLTRETGEVDEWGTPITENCYEYNIHEVFIKLLALKDWLEKNIIGVNCRITDITGEGVYLERYRNILHTTDNIGYYYSVRETMTPYPLDHSSELVYGDASIRLTLLELMNRNIGHLPVTFGAMVDHLWDPCTGLTYHINDPSALALDPSLNRFLKMGPLFSYPFRDLKDIQWKISVEKPTAGVVGEFAVTNPLFIYNNELRYYNIFDSSSIFYNSSTNLNLLLEKAYFRDPSIDVWEDSVAWTLAPNASANGYIMVSPGGNTYLFHDFMNLRPTATGKLQYAIDSNYKVPLLTIDDFTFRDSSGNVQSFPQEYILDIIDGKIIMDCGTQHHVESSAGIHTTLFINFNYDTSLNEQMITLNAVYESERMPLYVVDPSEYYWADPSGKTGGVGNNYMKADNNIYNMYVNHIGAYNVEVFGWDGFNTLFYNKTNEPYDVWIKRPTRYSLIDSCCNISCVSTFMTQTEVETLIDENLFPIYDRIIPLQGLSLQYDASKNPYIRVPSITYFQDVPQPDTFNRFFNMTERVLSINDPIIEIDRDYQKFYAGDDVNLVKFDKGKYELVKESSSHIVSLVGNTLTLDQVPVDITIDSSSDVYILNDTYRSTVNASNNYTTNQVKLDIIGDPCIYRVGQLVGLIATDLSAGGYSWGSSYRVVNVDNSTYTFDNLLPAQFIDNTSKYKIEAKHAFSSYSSFVINTKEASETNNQFNIYLKDSYCQEYYLDNTFIYANVLFDQEIVNSEWYDTSLNLVNGPFYYHKNYIEIDGSTLVIMRALYDSSMYMLNQKNIWTARFNDTKDYAWKVFNNDVPYIFGRESIYDIAVDTYDSYGNLVSQDEFI